MKRKERKDGTYGGNVIPRNGTYPLCNAYHITKLRWIIKIGDQIEEMTLLATKRERNEGGKGEVIMQVGAD